MKRPLATSLVPIVFFSLLVLFAAGCASTGNSTMDQPLSANLSRFKSAVVEIKSNLSSPTERQAEFLEHLQIRIIVKLREAKAFEKIYPQAETDSHCDLRITVTITKIRDVDNFNRIMWGIMAGQARTEAMVEFTEQATGKLIGSGKIEGKSSNGTIFSGTTSEAVDRVADEVVKLVLQHL